MLPTPDPDRKKQHYADGFWREETIYALAAARHTAAPKSGYLDRLRRLTYQQFVEAADALAGDLRRNGLQPGDRVGIWLPSESRDRRCHPRLRAQRLRLFPRPATRSYRRTSTRPTSTHVGIGLDPGTGLRCGCEPSRYSPGLDALASLKTVYSLPPLEKCSDRTPYGLTEPDSAPAENDPDSVVYLPFTSGTRSPKAFSTRTIHCLPTPARLPPIGISTMSLASIR